MIKVGLTGNIGSGKSTVSRIFSALNVPVFIADVEAKLLYSEAEIKEEIKSGIGDQVFDSNGEVDLKLMAELIFNDKEALLKINRIIHPRTLSKYHQWLEDHKLHIYTLHESAILFENNLQDHFDKIINISAPFETRLIRATERDGIEQKKVMERMKNQMPDEEKNKLADFVIVNDGNQLLIPQVIEIDKKLKNK